MVHTYLLCPAQPSLSSIICPFGSDLTVLPPPPTKKKKIKKKNIAVVIQFIAIKILGCLSLSTFFSMNVWEMYRQRFLTQTLPPSPGYIISVFSFTFFIVPPPPPPPEQEQQTSTCEVHRSCHIFEAVNFAFTSLCCCAPHPPKAANVPISPTPDQSSSSLPAPAVFCF